MNTNDNIDEDLQHDSLVGKLKKVRHRVGGGWECMDEVGIW